MADRPHLKMESLLAEVDGLMKADRAASTHRGLPTETHVENQHSSLHRVQTSVLPGEVRATFEGDNRDMFRVTKVFPEIHRAFVTWGRKLYCWNYTCEDDLQIWESEEEQGDILAILLTRPKPGVFQNEPDYLLLVSTSCNVIFLKLYFEANGDVDSKVHISLSRFIIDTPRVRLLNFCASPDYCIYSGGEDGRIYRIEYRNSWLSRSAKCRKVEPSWGLVDALVDYFNTPVPVLDLVYRASLMEYDLILKLYVGNKIEIFQVHSSGGIKQLATLNVFSMASKWWNEHARVSGVVTGGTLFGSDDEIVSIFPIENGESSGDEFAIVTKLCRRIYIHVPGTPKNGILGKISSTVHSSSSAVVVSNVEAPRPSFYRRQATGNPNAVLLDAVNRPSSIYSSFYRDGVLVAATARRELAVFLRQEEEYSWSKYETLRLDGDSRVFDLVEDRFVYEFSPIARLLQMEGSNPSEALSGYSTLSLQHLLPRRKFICLADSRVTLVSLETPLDRFISCLVSSENANVGLEYLKRFAVDEVLSMCYLLACGAHEFRPLLGEFGANPRAGHPAAEHSSIVYSGNAYSRSDMTGLTEQCTGYFLWFAQHHPKVVPKGILKAVSRVVTPVWHLTLNALGVAQSDPLGFQSRNDGYYDVVNSILQWVERLAGFLGEGGMQHWKTDHLDVSLEHVDGFLRKIVCVLWITVSLIAHPSTYRLLKHSENESLSRLSQQRVKDLVEKPDVMKLCRAVIRIIMNDDPTNIYWVRQLQDKCPELVLPDDVDIYSANHMLSTLDNRSFADDKRLKRKEAVELYKRAVQKRDFVAKDISTPITMAKMHGEFVEVMLTRASLIANNRISGIVSPPVGISEKQLQCYIEIADVVGPLWLQPSETTKSEKNSVIRVVDRSTDQAFCTFFFDWLHKHGLSEEIPVFKSPFVATYLQSKHNYKRLMVYFERHRFFKDGHASCVSLAQEILMPASAHPTLEDRVYLLKKAIEYIGFSSDLGVVHGHQNVFDVRRMLNFAEIQLALVKELQELRVSGNADPRSIDVVLDTLSKKLVTPYHQLLATARQFKLWSITLDLMYSLRDTWRQGEIEDVWDSIIEKAHLVSSSRSPLRHTMVTLGKRYHSIDAMFPLSHILYLLFGTEDSIPANITDVPEPLEIAEAIGIPTSTIMKALNAEHSPGQQKDPFRYSLIISGLQVCNRILREAGHARIGIEIARLMRSVLTQVNHWHQQIIADRRRSHREETRAESRLREAIDAQGSRVYDDLQIQTGSASR